jgi:hypothetical protein
VATETSVVVEVAATPGEVLARKAAAESPARAAELAPAKAAAHMRAAEPAPHMNAAAETAATVSSPTATSRARRRVSGQSAESGSRRQNDHGLA